MIYIIVDYLYYLNNFIILLNRFNGEALESHFVRLTSFVDPVANHVIYQPYLNKYICKFFFYKFMSCLLYFRSKCSIKKNCVEKKKLKISLI